IVLHSLYSPYALTQRPLNLFSGLRIPLARLVERIRALLLSEVAVGEMVDLQYLFQCHPISTLELLLNRLKTDESRGWFVRFGQRALQTCAPCTSAGNYALFVFAGAILAYVRTAAVLLLLTSSANGRDRWRGYVLGVLVCAALAEGYVVSSVSAVPLLTQFLPPSEQPGPPSISLAEALAYFECSLPRAHLLKCTRG
ncbi:hypothetical protein EDB19DRAFT_1641086, partial [Suillus lakei]